MVSSPSPPDPAATAAAQGAANRSAAIASAIVNNPNERTPFGDVSYKTIGYQTITGEDGNPKKVPIREKSVSLSAAEQSKLNKRNTLENSLLSTGISQMKTVQESLKDPLKTGNLTKRLPVAQGKEFAMKAQGIETGPTGYASGGTVQGRNFSLGRVDTDFGGAGSVQRTVAKTAIPDNLDYDRNAFSVDRRRVEDAMMSRFNEDFGQRRQQLDTELQAKGFDVNSTAYRDAMDELRRQETDAKMQAIVHGGQEQSRLLGDERATTTLNAGLADQRFGQNVTRGEFANRAQQQVYDQQLGRGEFERDSKLANFDIRMNEIGVRNAAQQQAETQNRERAMFKSGAIQANNATRFAQAEDRRSAEAMAYANERQRVADTEAKRSSQLSERAYLRQMPLNEITAVLSGAQTNVPQSTPYFQQGIEPAPIGDYIYRDYEQRSANSRAQMSGLFGLGSSLMGGAFSLMSDERVKHKHRQIGYTMDGVPIWLWSYKLDHDNTLHIGPMAQDVQAANPDAVFEVDGILHLDLTKVH